MGWRVSFWRDKKDLKFDRDGGCTTLNELNVPELHMLK